MNQVLFVDAKNAIYRFGWVNRHLATSDGVSTGAVYGLIGMLLRLANKFPGAMPVVVWDGDNVRSGWRYKLFPDYKVSRYTEAGPGPEVVTILEQIPKIQRLLQLIGVLTAKVAEVEADDVISALAGDVGHHDVDAIVYSMDRDFWQLLSRGITVLTDKDPKNKMVPVTDAHIQRQYRCKQRDVLKVRAIMGDKSDCIPGVIYGVGMAKAAEMVHAGADPGCPVYSKRFGEPCERLRPVWRDVRRNFELMWLPATVNDDVHFTPEQQLQLRCILTSILARLNSPKMRSNAQYQEMVAYLSDLELRDAIAKREAIWRLGC